MSLAVNPLSPALGAEITGARLGRPIAEEDFDVLHRALLDHLMVVVRDQDLAPEDQIALSARFGALESHDNAQYLKDGHPEILVLSNKRVNGQLIGVPDAGDAWHSDLSFKPETAMYTMLQSVDLPGRGGDTEFANMYAAYDALPEATRRRIATLRAIHSISKLRNPHPMENVFVAYIVLGAAMVFEAGAWWVALKERARSSRRSERAPATMQ